jgi:hypothetical protein
MFDGNLLFILFILSATLSVFVGRYGEKKGFPFSRGFFLFLLLSPLLGAMIIGFTKPRQK